MLTKKEGSKKDGIKPDAKGADKGINKPPNAMKKKILTEDIDKILPEKLAINSKEELEEISPNDGNIEWESDENGKEIKKSAKGKEEDESEKGEAETDTVDGSEDGSEEKSGKDRGFFRIKKFFRRR